MLLFSQLFHFFDNHPVRNDHMKIVSQECVSDDIYSGILEGVL